MGIRKQADQSEPEREQKLPAEGGAPSGSPWNLQPIRACRI